MNMLANLRKIRLYIVTSLGLIFLYLLLKYTAPYFIVVSIHKFIEDDYIEKVTFSNVSFEPLGLKLKLSNLKLNDDTSLDNLYLNFSFPNLFQREIHISQIQIEGLKSNVIKKDNKILISGIKYQDKEENENKAQPKWSFKVDKAEISNSVIVLNKEHKIEFKKLEANNFDTRRSDKIAEFKTLLCVNGSDILFDGKLSDTTLIVNFTLNDFDLNILNVFLDKENLSLGKVNGKLSSKGAFELKDDIAKLGLNLDLREVFLYSKDLKVINYFIKRLKAERLSLVSNESDLNIKSSSINIANLLLSVPSEKFNKSKLSKFSDIRINDINISKNKEAFTTKAVINFVDRGFFALNQYKANNKIISDVKVSNVDLAQFSESFESLISYQIQSGNLSIDSKTSLNDENIRGNVKVKLGQIKLDNKNELGEKLANQSLIPLKTAISMIKDGDGNVKLDFKVYGNKGDPNFDIMGMLSKGVGSVAVSKISSIIATKVAVKFTPLLMSSIPLSPGNIFTFANGAYKIITKPRFKDIDFVASKSKIRESSQNDLIDLANFLRENKKISLHICPVASTLEFDNKRNNKEKTLSLANERVKTLKKYFMKQNDNDFVDQIIFCRPAITNNDDIGKAVISI